MSVGGDLRMCLEESTNPIKVDKLERLDPSIQRIENYATVSTSITILKSLSLFHGKLCLFVSRLWSFASMIRQ